MPYDVVVLRHPELSPQGERRRPRRYRVLIAPARESLGRRPRATPLATCRAGHAGRDASWACATNATHAQRRRSGKAARRGRAPLLLGGASFPRPAPAGRAALGARLLAELAPLLPDPRVSGELAPTTWVKTWRPRAASSPLITCYALDYASGSARPAPEALVVCASPSDVRAEQALCSRPASPIASSRCARGGVAEVTCRSCASTAC